MFWVYALVSGIILYAAIVLGPFFPIPAALVIISFIVFLGLKREGFDVLPYVDEVVEKRDLKSPILKFALSKEGMVLLLFLGGAVILAMVTGVAAAVSVPWKTLIMAGLVADVVSVFFGFLETGGYLSGFVPGVLVSLAGAIVSYLLVSMIVGGGIVGVLVGSLSATISLIPGPIPLNTVSFIGLKLLL